GEGDGVETAHLPAFRAELGDSRAKLIGVQAAAFGIAVGFERRDDQSAILDFLCGDHRTVFPFAAHHAPPKMLVRCDVDSIRQLATAVLYRNDTRKMVVPPTLEGDRRKSD